MVSQISRAWAVEREGESDQEGKGGVREGKEEAKVEERGKNEKGNRGQFERH